MPWTFDVWLDVLAVAAAADALTAADEAAGDNGVVELCASTAPTDNKTTRALEAEFIALHCLHSSPAALYACMDSTSGRRKLSQGTICSTQIHFSDETQRNVSPLGAPHWVVHTCLAVGLE